MKTCAIICEYNPLHNGHVKLIQYAKSIADYCVCIMSGNFTQRALPAVADKYTRAKHAVLAGADAVVEIPVIFAISSAPNFAYCGVNIATRLGCDYLLFGSECGDINALTECANSCDADLLNVKQAMSTGISFPKAMSTLLPQFAHILDKPNNILAVEYIKAIQRLNSKITPITIQRQHNYNDNSLQGDYVSATAIRNNVSKADVLRYMPAYVLSDIDNTIEQQYKQLVAKTISTYDTDYLSNIEGVTEGIENSIFKYATIGDYDKLVQQVKSKRYTQMRIQRILLCALLGITKNDVSQYSHNTSPINLLAIGNQSDTLLSYWQSIATNIATTEGNSWDINKKANRQYMSLTGKSMPHSVQKITR